MVLPSTNSFKEFSGKVFRSQIQYLFLTMLLTLIPFLLSFLNEVNSIVQSFKSANPTYKWPAYTDLCLAVLVTTILFVCSSIFTRFYSPFGKRQISAKYKGKEREFKEQKHIECSFKLIFYVFVSFLGLFVSKNTNFSPSWLGGSGDASKMFEGYPYQQMDSYDSIKFYLMIQLGYHLYSLLQHISKEPKNDFIEMLLHHLMTVCLIGLAYFMNFVAISLLVLLCHDFSDVFGYLVRIFVDTPYKSLTLASYFGLLSSWFYLRLIVFPFVIINYTFYIYEGVYQLKGYLVLGAMLHFLVVLHAYWFYLFIQMGLKFLKTKTTEDTYHVE